MTKNEMIEDMLTKILYDKKLFSYTKNKIVYDKKPFSYTENKKSIFQRIIEHYQRRKVVKRINKALGFVLREWQIQYIFKNQSTPLFIELSRGGGKTTAHILFVLLNPVMDGIVLKRVNTQTVTQWLRYDPQAYAKILYGEDGASLLRQEYFTCELMKIRDILNSSGIKTNNITIGR